MTEHTTIANPGFAEAPVLEPGRTVGQRYTIVNLLGTGGMGAVYRAQDLELGIEVALKVLRPEYLGDADALEKLKAELLMARQVSHRNVVRIHDFGSDSDSGVKYISMAHIEGQTLRGILQEEGKLPLARAVPWMLEICAGLEAAHEVGVVHRDLKPENVLIDSRGQSFITDFGIARSVEKTGSTRTGAVVGTLQYMSPEQARGETLDHRSDVYSFGLMAYEMITGRLPHETETTPEFVGRMMGRKPTHPREYEPGLPEYFARILLRCLDPDPAMRFPRIRDVARCIQDQKAEGAPLLSAAGMRRIARSTVVRYAAGLLLVLALGAFAGYEAMRRSGNSAVVGTPTERPGVPIRGSIAVLPFLDRSSDAELGWLATGLPELIVGELANSRELRVASPAVTFQLLQDLKVRDAGVHSDSTLRQVSRFLSCDFLLTGSFARAGDGIALDLKLHKSGAGELVETAALHKVGAPRDILALVSGLSAEVRKRISPSLEKAPAPSAAITQSPEALKSYSVGISMMRQGEYSKAIEEFQRATLHDASFSLAFARLSEALYQWGHPVEARSAYEKAIATAKSSDHKLLDSLQIRAQHALLINDLAQASQLFEEAAAAWPNSVDIHLSLGDTYDRKGEMEKAVASYEKAAALEPNNFRVSLALGRFYIMMENYDQAVDKLSKALGTSTQLSNDQGRADVLNALGIVHQRMQRFDEAERSFLESIAIKQKLGDKRGIAASLQNISILYSVQGKYPPAEAKAHEARKIFEELDNRQGTADVYFNLGHIYQDTGRFDEALDSFRRSLTIARELGNPAFLAQLDERTGQIYYFLGRYADADTYQRQALAERERIGDEPGIIRSLQSLGDLDLEQARFPRALERHRAALERSRKLGATEASAVSISQMGLIYQLQGRYKAALDSYMEAVPVFTQLRLKGRLAEIEKRLAALYLEVRDLQKAGQHLVRAVREAGEVRDKSLLGEISLISGQVALAERRPADARQSFDKALQLARETRFAKSILLAEIGLGGLESTSGNRRTAVAMLRRSLSQAEQGGHAEATARCYVALLRVAEEKIDSRQIRRWFDRVREYGLNRHLLEFASLAAAREAKSGHAQQSAEYQGEFTRLLESLEPELSPEHHRNLVESLGPR